MRVFDFDKYHPFVKNFIKQLPKGGHGQSRKIAEYIGVSTTYFSQILAGSKPLTLEQAVALSNFMHLPKLEADYFFHLVLRERAGTKELRKTCDDKLIELKDQSNRLANRIENRKTLSDHDKAIFYSVPIYSALHLFTSTNNKGRTLEEIANRFDLSSTRALELIEFLKSTGLIIQEDSHYKVGTLATHVDSQSPYLMNHLANWRLKAIDAAKSLSADELSFTTNVSLSKDDFKKLRKEMIEFIQGFLKRVDSSPAEELACMNMDFFWIRKSE